jgi:hypothetical protein
MAQAMTITMIHRHRSLWPPSHRSLQQWPTSSRIRQTFFFTKFNLARFNFFLMHAENSPRRLTSTPSSSRTPTMRHMRNVQIHGIATISCSLIVVLPIRSSSDIFCDLFRKISCIFSHFWLICMTYIGITQFILILICSGVER